MKPPIEFRAKLKKTEKVSPRPRMLTIREITSAGLRSLHTTNSDAAAVLERMRAKGRARAKAYRAKKKTEK